jgi:hypothetical protein
MADPEVDLETEIRNILYNDYGTGNQSIDSAEIYDKLIAKGINPPERAMAEIFKSLKDRGLIKGPGRLDSEGARKHGAWDIMWVSRHIAV